MAAVPTRALPYGEADFCRIRLNRWLYVDRPALRLPEQERYAFLIRPRRLGKSLWVSLPENYYDASGATSSTGYSPAPTSAQTDRRTEPLRRHALTSG